MLGDAARGPSADSQATLVFDGDPARVSYRLACDRRWRARRLVVQVATGEGSKRLVLRGDGNGAWWDDGGAPLPALGGCIDLDVSSSPFTNTLPIRRISLAEGGYENLRVAYVSVPRLAVTPVSQRYSYVGRSESGALYHYRCGAFEADLVVDDHGLVLDYPGAWRRIPLACEHGTEVTGR